MIDFLDIEEELTTLRIIIIQKRHERLPKVCLLCIIKSLQGRKCSLKR